MTLLSTTKKGFVYLRRLGLLLFFAGYGATAIAHVASYQESVVSETVAAASAALSDGDNARAEALFRKALISEPDSLPLLNNLALSIGRQNRYDEAIVIYHQALTQKPRDAITERNLGIALFRANHFADAAPFLVEASTSTPSFQLLELTGLDLFAMDQYARAVHYLEMASALNPESLETLDVLGKAYVQLADYPGVKRVFTRVMMLNPGSAEAHVLLALAYDKLFQEDEAIREFNLAAQVDPAYPGIHTGLGSIYWRSGNSTAAKREFLLELQRFPKDAVANCTMGLLLRRGNEAAEAVPYFQAALSANPTYVDALRELGQSWLSLHKPEEALAPLQKLITLTPNDSEAHYIYGTTLLQMGRSAEGDLERKRAGELLAARHKTDASKIAASAQ